jgi:SAM-dependent methyltransferase
LPFKDKVFSKVSIVAVLEHIIDDYQVVKELYRVTKPGGVIFVMVPNTYLTMNPVFIIPYLIHDKKVGHIRHYSLRQLTKLFAIEGFKYIEGFYTGHLIKPIQILISKIIIHKPLSEKLWWYIENLDWRMKRISTGVSINAIFKKL